MSIYKIDEVCEVIKGNTPIQKAVCGEYPLVVTAEERLTNENYQFDCKAVCIPLVSSTGHGHASIKRIHFQEGKFALGNILAAVIPKNLNILRTEYLYVYLSYMKDIILVPLMKGSANVSLTIAALKSVEIEVPSINMQESIIKLSKNIKVDREILNNALEMQLSDINELRKSILYEAVQGKLVLQDDSDESGYILLERLRKEKNRLILEKKIKRENYNSFIDINEYKDELPMNWSLARLGDLSSLITKQTGFDYTKHIKPNLVNYKDHDNIPMIQTKNFKGDEFNLKTDYYLPINVAKKFPRILLDSDCLLLSIVGASIGNIGIFQLNQLCILGGAICKVNLLNNDLLEYIYYFLLSPQGQNEIMKNYKSTAQGTITVKDVREIIIYLPPLEEQKRIVEKINQLMFLCDELEENIKQSKEQSELLVQSVLQKAFINSNEEHQDVSFGEFIKQKRREKGITILGMLKLLKDMKSSEYTKIEEDVIKPEMVVIEKIAKALNLSDEETKVFKKLEVNSKVRKYIESEYETKIAARRIKRK